LHQYCKRGNEPRQIDFINRHYIIVSKERELYNKTDKIKTDKKERGTMTIKYFIVRTLKDNIGTFNQLELLSNDKNYYNSIDADNIEKVKEQYSNLLETRLFYSVSPCIEELLDAELMSIEVLSPKEITRIEYELSSYDFDEKIIVMIDLLQNTIMSTKVASNISE
jgi:hypothetical protein